MSPVRPAKVRLVTMGGVGGVRDLARTYVKERVALGQLSRGTAHRQLHVLYGFADSYGRRPVEQLSYRAVERWMGERSGGWQPSTRRQQWSVVKGFCGWLHSRRILHADPFAGQAAPRGGRPSPLPLAAVDVERLFAVLPDARAHLVVTLMYVLAMRCGTVSRLRLDDIVWASGEIRCVGKGGSVYLLPLDDDVRHAIERYLAECPATNGPLIRSYNRPQHPLGPDALGALVREWMRAAGIKRFPYDRRSAHTLRTTALTETARANGDPYVVQALAGHASITTATWYVPRLGTGHVALGLQKRRALRGAQ